MRPVLATSACPASDAASLLAGWQMLATDQVNTLALDSRLPLELCREVLRSLRTRIACVELPYRVPVRGPSPLSDDRHERAAARDQLLRTLELAAEHGVARVVLHPARLPLSTAVETLRERFARGLPLGIDELLEERTAVAGAAIDHLCTVLDAVLRAAEAAGTTLAFLTPSPWPQQCPNALEVEQLRDIFGGAHHGVIVATDWAHVAEVLGERPRDIDGASAVRLADACGLRPQLPLDTGEADWRGRLSAARAPSADVVIALAAGARPAEVRRSLELCATACADARSASDRA